MSQVTYFNSQLEVANTAHVMLCSWYILLNMGFMFVTVAIQVLCNIVTGIFYVSWNATSRFVLRK